MFRRLESSGMDVDANATLGFLLVLFAGLATGIGASAVFFKQLVMLASTRILAAGIGISAGVMVYVSFIEIFQKSVGAFSDHGVDDSNANLYATLCFFAGIVLMKLLGLAVHYLDERGSHHVVCSHDPPVPVPGSEGAALPERSAEIQVEVDAGGETSQEAAKAAPDAPTEKDAESEKKLMRMGLNTALAIALHNFPEGLATFVGTLADPAVGVTLAVAIAIHNIPEGLCVALPIYYATGNRVRAFLWGLLSGISEPIGALVGYAIIKASGEDMNLLVYGVLFGLVGGMMVAIVILELLPTAFRYDPQDAVTTNATFGGMLIMALSLVMFTY
jgi:ZIP family zinc transporter